jgi:hypothetical protein
MDAMTTAPAIDAERRATQRLYGGLKGLAAAFQQQPRVRSQASGTLASRRHC